ncbi:hypothetical protein HOLleu_18346 [Holothuria leucospilota]|uniref:Uncharacterized protein n=1 Tax=Holothuria leucospilota TaxID=206669 RepID=A0A9Q1H9T0_HOLLE|nr:hypothetical protein HOLleu_18346 [Holothuria leucospilota]
MAIQNRQEEILTGTDCIKNFMASARLAATDCDFLEEHLYSICPSRIAAHRFPLKRNYQLICVISYLTYLLKEGRVQYFYICQDLKVLLHVYPPKEEHFEHFQADLK